jgi:hypothetical protein
MYCILSTYASNSNVREKSGKFVPAGQFHGGEGIAEASQCYASFFLTVQISFLFSITRSKSAD